MTVSTQPYTLYIPNVQSSSVPGRIHGIDVSSYQDNTIPWTNFYNAGMKRVVVKGGQDLNTNMHIYLAKDAGFEVQEYFWHYPRSSVRYQVDTIAKEYMRYLPSMVWLDVEQWWMNWDEYWLWLSGKTKKENVAIINHNMISDNAFQILTELKKLGVPCGIYTARWFQEEYAPEIASWINQFDLWVAYYIDYGKSSYNVTLEQFFNSPQGVPLLPRGATKWKAWQFSSRMKLPGYRFNLDCDVWEE